MGAASPQTGSQTQGEAQLMRSGRGRRTLLALVAVMALGAAACGDDDGDAGAGDAGSATTSGGSSETSGGSATTGGATTIPDDADPTGIVRIGISLDPPGGAQLDPADTVINSDESWIFPIYGTLMRESADGTIEPWLAESVTIVDPQTIDVVLHEGITFSDGAPYDAEAVRRGILRNLNEPGSPGVPGGRNFTFAELQDIVVKSPLEMTFQLKSPVAGEFFQVLAGRESAVPSPKALDAGLDPSTDPVGAGPYVLEEFRPLQILSLRKNPNFFEADKWPLGGIDFVHAISPATANGLQGGQIDLAAGLTQGELAPFRANSNKYEVAAVHRDFDYFIINFCRTKEPFVDVRVRQAFQLALNREEINQAWLGGEGQVAYGFWPEGHPYFDPDLKRYAEHDPERARQLLEEAGVDNLRFDLVQPYMATGHTTRLAEIVQAQLAEVGFDANIVFTPNVVVDFIQPQKPGTLMNPGSRPGVDRVAKIFKQGFQQALCGTSDEEIMAWADEAASLDPQDPRVAELYHQIERKMHENAYVVFLAKQPSFFAWDKDVVGGEAQFSGQKGLLLLDTIYVRK